MAPLNIGQQRFDYARLGRSEVPSHSLNSELGWLTANQVRGIWEDRDKSFALQVDKILTVTVHRNVFAKRVRQLWIDVRVHEDEWLTAVQFVTRDDCAKEFFLLSAEIHGKSNISRGECRVLDCGDFCGGALSNSLCLERNPEQC